MSHGLTAGRAVVSGVVLVLALLTSLLSPAPAQAAGGILAGTLTGPDGKAFEYFQIDVYRADGPDAWEHAIPPVTITSWDTGLPVGEFAVPLPAGSYRACFHALTYESVEKTGQECWQGGFDVFGATDIVIADGETTTITPSLPREARLHGRVTGARGAGVSAYVAPYRRAPDGTWTLGYGAQSIADGSFVLTDLDPGTYRFCLLDVPREYLSECWDDVSTLAEATEVVVPPGGNPPFYFRLARRANISGTVTRPPGSTASIYVTAHRWRNERWEQVAYAGVDPDGGYRITGLDAGTYRVCADGYEVVRTCWRSGSQVSGATDIVLATGQYRGGVDLAPGPAGFVTGTLPDVYLGAQGYPNVTAWRQVQGGWEGTATGEAVPTGIGNDWTYQIGSLPTGTYVVCVDHADPEFVPAFPHTCHGNSPTPQGGIPVEVVAGTTTSGVDIATGRAGEIRGRVTGASPARVDLFTAAGRFAQSQMTAVNGRYRFREIPSGDYYVGFHRAPGRSSLAAEWWKNRTDGVGPTGATPITVDGNIVAGISAILDPGGALTGRVVDESGDPVVGCLVKARGRDDALAVRTATTDATGAFAIDGLSTASYLVYVAQRCSGTPTGMFYDAESPTRTTARTWEAETVAVTRGLTVAMPADLRTGPPAIVPTGAPTIAGVPAVGRTLTAHPGSWLPAAGVAYAYRWYAAGVRVPGASGRTLDLTPDLVGTRIRVQVIASARGWTSATGRSAAVGPVS